MAEQLNIKVAIVEDDAEIRQALSLIIGGTPGFTCDAVYPTCDDALKALPAEEIDVVLMDIEMPGTDGIAGVAQLKPQMQETDFIMLSVREDEQAIFDALCAGASGYLVKDTPPSMLLAHLKEVKNGGAPMSSSIARKVVKSFRQEQQSPLSDRETEVLQLLCDGMNYRAIADQLFLSSHTVKTHIKNIYRKLHVSSRGEAVSKAIRDNLV